MHEQLTQEGCEVGRERVARLLRDMGLMGLPTKRFRHITDSAHGLRVAPNVLARNFAAERPNARWATDITYLWTWEGWLYLAVVLDLCSRRVVGWAVQPPPADRAGPRGAADGPRATRAGPRPGAPSDRGCQYAAMAY